MVNEMTQEEKIKQMYAANLASQKETLQQDYEKADADYIRQQEKAQKAVDANLTRTAVEAQKEVLNNAEINNAAGLSSGARAQMRLSNQNQMRSDMTALRMQQQEIDAEIDRSRSLLSQEYASAIRKAQQDNDLALAEALYAEAEKQDALLRQQQEKEAAEKKQNDLTAAQLLAQTGDYTRIGKYYGLSDEEIAKLNSVAMTTQQTQGAANNGGLDSSYITNMQEELGVDMDGRWGPESREAAYKMWGTTDPVKAYEKHEATRTYYNQLLQSIYAANSAIRNQQYPSMTERSLAHRDAYFYEWVPAVVDAHKKGYITLKQRSDLLGIMAIL